MQVARETRALGEGPRCLSSRALAERAREEGRLGIDTEFMPEGRYRPLLCLVQIASATRSSCSTRSRTSSATRRRWPRCSPIPAVEVVLHAGRQDVAILRRAWRTTFTNVFDTQVAAGFAGFSAQAGYTGLLHDVLKIRLAEVGLLHPLGRAAAHARAAPLRARGRRAPAAARRRAPAPAERAAAGSSGRARSAARSPRRRTSATPRRCGGGCRASPGLDPRERAIARELAAWRERTAAAEDRPVGSVVRDPTLVELAKRGPRDAQGARARSAAPGPDVVRRRAQRHPRRARARPRRAEPIRLDEGERLSTEAVDGPTIALAESLVRARAQEAGLAYELIAARADLAPIVVAARRGRPEPDVRTLRGWRRELVGEELLELLAGQPPPRRGRTAASRWPEAAQQRASSTRGACSAAARYRRR